MPLRRVLLVPGARTVLGVTLLVLVGHQAVYTYLAPFVAASGGGRASVVLLVFGVGTVAGIWVVGAVIDRFPGDAAAGAGRRGGRDGGAGRARRVRGAGRGGGVGVAFGGVPTLLQSALVNVAGAGNADVATSLQTTVYNAGIAAGSLAGGVVLEGAGAGALPWTAFPLVAVALAVAVAARRHAFPGSPPAPGQRPVPDLP
ncbi:hypothetical protein ACFQYP_23465 [Nonomuraea antimicrobica]